MAVIDVLATELGRPLTEAETLQATLWVTDARMLIQARLGDLSALDQNTLDYVVRKAVAERLTRPYSGADEESEQIDDYKVTRKYRQGVSIRDDWWELLSPDNNAGAWTIGPKTVYSSRTCDAEPVDL